MKKFFVIWSSQAFSIFGSSVVGFALVWYLTKETGSATVLATAMMLNFIPQVVLGPFIGPFIDRWDRKLIIIFADLFTALLTLALVLLFLTHTIQIWHIYVAMIGRSIGGTFQGPALGASIPMIVSEKHLARANGLNMTLQGIINIIGPPAGAFLMEALPMQNVLAVDIITAAIAIGCIIPLAIPRPPRTTLSLKPNVFKDMAQGFRYILSWRGLLFLFILFSLMNFFAAPIVSLMPLYVTEHLGGEVLRFGWMGTAMGIGTVAGGLLVGAWGGFKRKIVTVFAGVIFECVAIIGLGFVTESVYIIAIAMMFIIGFGMAISNAPIGAILQSVVARDVQGRVFSLLGSVSAAMMPLGLAVTGPVANAIGIRPMFYITGGAILLLVLIGFLSRDLMNVENQKATETVPAVEQ
jgi:DHA3 family macrolide efflux protein-like MFS transporter